MGRQFISEPCVSICGFDTLLKGTVAVLSRCSGNFSYQKTFHVFSTPGLDPRIPCFPELVKLCLLFYFVRNNVDCDVGILVRVYGVMSKLTQGTHGPKAGSQCQGLTMTCERSSYSACLSPRMLHIYTHVHFLCALKIFRFALAPRQYWDPQETSSSSPTKAQHNNAAGKTM